MDESRIGDDEEQSAGEETLDDQRHRTAKLAQHTSPRPREGRLPFIPCGDPALLRRSISATVLAASTLTEDKRKAPRDKARTALRGGRFLLWAKMLGVAGSTGNPRSAGQRVSSFSRVVACASFAGASAPTTVGSTATKTKAAAMNPCATSAKGCRNALGRLTVSPRPSKIEGPGAYRPGALQSLGRIGKNGDSCVTVPTLRTDQAAARSSWRSATGSDGASASIVRRSLPLISILRGFIASGISRISSIESRPSCLSAASTRTKSASAKR